MATKPKNKKPKQDPPHITVDLRMPGLEEGGLTQADAKQILGWTIEPQKADWGKQYTLRDLNGNRIRLQRCTHNRPFRLPLARRYASDMLRGKWALNGETIIIDCKGQIQSGQHRLVGLILAEQTRKQDPDHWPRWREKSGGETELEIPALIVNGISDRPETVDTLDIGDKRRLGDVLFRRREYQAEDLSQKDQQRLSNILAVAVRLVWLRVGGQLISDAPHFPHSEALDFLAEHPNIRDMVLFIYHEEGGGGAEGRLISSKMSPGYAAGLMYLMATTKTNPDGGEIDFTHKGKAEDFWVQFASGANLHQGSPILTLRNQLDKIDSGGAKGREQVCGMVVKAWNAFIDGKQLTPRQCRIKERINNQTNKRELAEYPRIGGLDVEHEIQPQPDPEPDPQENTKSKATTPKTAWKVGDTAWVRDDEEGHWFGTIQSINGKAEHRGVAGKAKVILVAKEDGEDYIVSLSTLRIDSPPYKD